MMRATPTYTASTGRSVPLGVAALLLAAAVPGASAGLTADDLVMLKRLSEPAVSPNGTRIAYTLRETDREADTGRTDLWLLDLEAPDAEPRRLTNDPAADSSARWSPGGERLYFLSRRTGSAQIWSMPMDFGEPTAVTDYPVGVSSFRIAPDGSRLAFTASILPECRDDLDCTAKRLEARTAGAATGQVYDRLMVRHWDRWADGTVSGLFTVRLDENGMPADAEPVLLTESLTADVPSQPFGDARDYAFTRDATRVIFTAKPESREEAWSTDFDLYAVDAGGGRPDNLTDDNPGRDSHPVPSPDGSSLAYLSMARAGHESDRRRVLLRDLRSGRTREVTPEWDRSPKEITFSATGRELYAVAADHGRQLLYRIDVETGTVLPLTASGTVADVALSEDAAIFRRHSLSSPADLYRLDLDTQTLDPLTAVNNERLAGIRMAEYEQFSFPGWNEETVYGYVVQPVDRDPDTDYPLALLVHGGPHGSFSDRFHYRWNPQVFAAAGYAVVTIDFHGSRGYGQAFADSIRGDWGGKPLEDLKRGLGAALSRYDWIDGQRVCALGASYGGYMVNWIAGNWPSRFRCLVNHDGLFDLRMMYYATEELWFPEYEFGAPYFDNPADYEDHNPLHHVRRWETPMLVIHGARDYRIPETQALATFTALQRRGIESRLLYFPDENHWVRKAANSVQWHREVLGWLERHLR